MQHSMDEAPAPAVRLRNVSSLRPAGSQVQLIKETKFPSKEKEAAALLRNAENVEHFIDQLGSHVTRLEKAQASSSKPQFAAEFEHLERESYKYINPTKVRVAQLHEDLNRYDDILPFDHNRVILDGSPDYINASLIQDVLPGTPQFIAAQGPLPECQRSFWEMISQHDVRIIVMVTNVREGDRIKCEQYWPMAGKPMLYAADGAFPNTMRVVLHSEEKGQAWVRRTFRVEYAGNKRKVVQYHFTDWPDFGVPESPRVFTDFVRVVMASFATVPRNADGLRPPLAVHCSAGVGRTGTFIGTFAALCSVHLLGSAKLPELSVSDIVREMRSQRMYMVQSLSQFVFLHHAILLGTDEILRDARRIKAEKSSPANSGNSSPAQRRHLSVSSQDNRHSRVLGAHGSIRVLRHKPRGADAVNGVRLPQYDGLVALLAEPSLQVISALDATLERKHIDTCAETLFRLFGTTGTLLPFVYRLAEWDVQNSTSEHMVFRRNSLATRIITNAMRVYGQNFLSKTLKPLIETMIESPNLSYEVNSSMLSAGENLGENRSALRRLAQQFLARLKEALPRAPTALRLMCHGVFRAARRRFPESAMAAVGGIFFLRFFCPSVVAPGPNGIFSGDIPIKVRRGLLLVSKVLQAVANCKNFTSFHEDYMQAFDSFVKSTAGLGRDILSNLSTAPERLDEVTLAHFDTFGIELQVAAGAPKDFSTLGRNQDGAVYPGLEGDKLSSLVELLVNVQPKIVDHLVSHGKQEVACELDKVLSVLWDEASGSVSVSPPNMWTKPKAGTAKDKPALWRHSIDYEEALEEAPLQAETYCNTHIKRAVVQHPSWDKFDRDYTPAQYTAPEVLEEPQWADADIQRKFAVIPFNTLDEGSNYDRRSACGAYKIVNGIPRNPMCRTGMAGRGLLGRWGPNHRAEVLITRWKRDQQGRRVARNGIPVMEVLMKRKASDPEAVDVIGCFSRPGQLVPNGVVRCFGCHEEDVKPCLDSADDESSVAPETAKEVFHHGKVVSQGYVSDPRNTDNAWIEAQCINFHDEMGILPEPTNSGTDTYEWVVLHSELQANDRTLSLLSKAASMRDAYFVDHIPGIMREIMRLVEQRGIMSEGVYRVSGSQARINKLKAQALGGDPSALQGAELQELTSLLRVVLRDMDPPLFGPGLYEQVIGVTQMRHEKDKIRILKNAIDQLPASNFRCLDSLVRHLKKVASESSKNRMTLENLALVFGPSIFKSPDGVKGDIADNAKQIMAAKELLLVPDEVWEESDGTQRRPPEFGAYVPKDKKEAFQKQVSRASLLEEHVRCNSVFSTQSVRVSKPTSASGTSQGHNTKDSDERASMEDSGSTRDSCSAASDKTIRSSQGSQEVSGDGSGHHSDTDDANDEDGTSVLEYDNVDANEDGTPAMEYDNVDANVDDGVPPNNAAEPLDARASRTVYDNQAQCFSDEEVSEADGESDEDEDEEDVPIVAFGNLNLGRASPPPAIKPSSPVPKKPSMPEASWMRQDVERSDMVGLKSQQPGSFLVYPSKTDVGNFCLSVWTGEYVWTGMIVVCGRNLFVEDTEEMFQSLEELVDFYSEEDTPAECKLLLPAAESDRTTEANDAADVEQTPSHTMQQPAEPESNEKEQSSVTLYDTPDTAAQSSSASSRGSSQEIDIGGGRKVIMQSSDKDCPILPATSGPNAQKAGIALAGATCNATTADEEPAAQQVADEYGGVYDASGYYYAADGTVYEPGTFFGEDTIMEGFVLLEKKQGKQTKPDKSWTRHYMQLQDFTVKVYNEDDDESAEPLYELTIDESTCFQAKKRTMCLATSEWTLFIQPENDFDLWRQRFQATMEAEA